MRSQSASLCLLQPFPQWRLGYLVLALLLANGVVLLGAKQVACAKENAPATEESESSADEAEPAIKETESDEPESKPAESAKKPSSSKKSGKKTEDAKSAPAKESDNKSEASDEEKKKAEIVENEKAKAEEAAGVEVEVIDDSEEEEPEETVEVETPVVVEETQKEPPKVEKRVIGATATIMEKKSELLFRARVDTGAKSCSLHVEDVKIENESDNMADNIGKVVRFHIKNGHKESHWLEAKIAGYVIIKTSNASDDRKRRYKVPLTFRYKDFEKTVLVTLNNREHMEFPLLLGRNFLKGDFVVDVELENND